MFRPLALIHIKKTASESMETDQRHTANDCIRLGDRCGKSGLMDKALVLYRQAVALEPEAVKARFKMAMALQRMGDTSAAETAYRQCLALDPHLAQAWNNLGAILRDSVEFEKAYACFRKAVALDPQMAHAHFNLGYLLEQAGRFTAAQASYEEALNLEPENAKICSQLVFLMQSSCSWHRIGRRIDLLDALTRRDVAAGGIVSETPFKCIARSEDSGLNAAVARFWSASVSARNNGIGLNDTGMTGDRPDRRIRIAYLSDRFRHAATAHQMCSVFGLHDHSEFSVTTYSWGHDDGSDYRRRIEADSDLFVDISGLDDRAAARRIQTDRVDILVDLKGHTENHRLGISAMRPAPVQATWLGFPGPAGADFFDYVICDPIVVPDDDIGHFTECPVRLPHTYYPTDYRQPVALEGVRRADVGLPEKAVVLSSFNQPFKIDPLIFDCWMSVMADVPDTVLWLQQKNDSVVANLRHEARVRGIDPGRLVFAGPLPKDQHLARLGLADLCLDTRIYNGHTTTVDALWVGVPVVAIHGTHFASRVSASLLTALGLPELIARDLDDYRELARALAADDSVRTDLRQRIIENRHRKPLFDSPRFVRHLEAAYRGMWRRHRSQLPPRPFDILEITTE